MAAFVCKYRNTEYFIPLYPLVNPTDLNERILKLFDFFLGKQRAEKTRLETCAKLLQENFKSVSMNLKTVLKLCKVVLTIGKMFFAFSIFHQYFPTLVTFINLLRTIRLFQDVLWLLKIKTTWYLHWCLLYFNFSVWRYIIKREKSEEIVWGSDKESTYIYSTIYRLVFRCSTAHQCSLVQSGYDTATIYTQVIVSDNPLVGQ